MDKEKYVDESWKESVAQDKERLNSTLKQEKDSHQSQTQHIQENSEEKLRASPETRGEVNFLEYASNLAFQAMVFLVQVVNPVTNQPEVNLEQAKYLIDTLVMLRDKTKGNLTKPEAQFLENSIYELQMNYVEHAEKEESP